MIFCFKHPYSEVGVYNPSRGAGFIIILVITKSPCIFLNQKKMAIHLAKFKYFTKRVSPSNHWLKQSEDSDMFWLCFDASPPSLSMNSTTDISFKKGRLVGDNSQFLDFWDDVRCHYTSPRKMVFHNTCFQIHRLPVEISVFFSMALWITWMRKNKEEKSDGIPKNSHPGYHFPGTSLVHVSKLRSMGIPPINLSLVGILPLPSQIGVTKLN